MKKILILTPFYPPNIGGAESFTQGLVDEARKHHNVTVLTYQPFKGGAPKMEVSKNLTVYRINWLLPQKTWKGLTVRNFINVFPKLLWSAYRLHRREKFDIIHAQGLISGLIGAIIKGKAKLFVTLLALYKWESPTKDIANWIFKKMDLIFCEGESGLDNVYNYYVHKKKLRKFNHWRADNTFRHDDKPNNCKTRVLFVGRAIPEKGKRIVEDAEKILYGDRFEFVYVENVKPQNLAEIYKSSDICVIPSIYDEGITRVVVESASFGCAIIASNRGSLPEQVKGFGMIVEPSPITFAEAILTIDYKSMGLKAYQFAKENFSSSNASTFLEEYDNALA